LDELRSFALSALRVAEPGARCTAVRALASVGGAIDTKIVLAEPPGVPGRPVRPQLVAPGALAQRAVGKAEGRAALLHALAHIEFNAIDLAWDCIQRFRELPDDYYDDWVGVARDEATHFLLLRARLRDLGADYGDLPAHNGLWEMAEKTAGNLLERMALVPRFLEARGLDVAPGMIDRLERAGDEASAAIVRRILAEEVAHVAAGSRWFRYLCELRGLDADAEHLGDLADRFVLVLEGK